MSVTVKFWSFSKRKNSTLIPTASPSYSYDCQIKAETTLINPIIELNTAQATGCNYAQITDFGRYYFIRDWTFDRGLWTASLEEDVLASYKSQIGGQTMYVTRSASSYDGNIKDMFYPTTDSVTYATPVAIRTARSFTTGNFVIGVLGNNPASAGCIYYQMSASVFSEVVKELFVEADNNVGWGDMVQGVINSLLNPTQYIVSCRWYPDPFLVENQEAGGLFAGLWSTGLISDIYRLTGSINPLISQPFALPKHPKAATRGSYMNLAPFSRYIIEWGSAFELDASLLANETNITVRIVPDFTTTDALLLVYPGSGQDKNPIVTTYVPYGVEIPLSQSSVQPGNIAPAAVQALASAATGNMLGTAAAILSVAESAIPTVTSTKTGGGLQTAMSPAYLKAAFYDVVDDDLADFGRPLMKKKQISTLSGFVRCQNDDISIACLDPERESIKAFMTGGFFYE